MIAHIRGRLIVKHPNQAIVECGGVGYDIVISVTTFTELPEAGAGEVALHIHTHVREDQIALYGFLRAEEKRLFEKLLTVSGIGPKLAIGVLSGMPVAEMVGALRSGEVARLTKIPGIGKKTAERMVLELRDKLEEFALAPARPAAPKATGVQEDVISALVNLGYQQAAAEKALANIGPQGEKSFEVLFRQAMAALTK
jgi:Holliday junction DNA helicase RuvA